MSDTKRYYWLKLQKDFFTSKRIKKLRKLAGGDTYTIIYLKMQLLALTNDGYLEYSGLEDTFADEIALDIDEEPENVKVAIAYLLSCGLVQTSDEKVYFLPYVAENCGSETASAIRGRKYRDSLTDEERDAERERARLGMQAVRERRNSECYERVTNVEKEIEKEIEIEIDTDIYNPNGLYVDYHKIVDLYNTICISLPKVTTLSDKRKKAIKARSKKYSEADFEKLFEKAEASDFLKGNNNRNWSATFDWLICDSNMAKVLDGNYDNRGKTKEIDWENV